MTRLPDDAVSRLREAAAWPELPPDRYELRELIGRGGMGAVYSAFDRRLDREVALKVSNGAAPASGLEERLRREALVLARLEHPGIVPVHDAGELSDGRWFYVMKLVRGRTLTDHAPGLAGEVAVLGIFERIAQTVAFAHDAGVVHRDLKPSNVMVGRFGEVLVLDWGVAKVLGSPSIPSSHDPSSSQGTAAGTRIGTPGFMAPEQERGETPKAAPASDVYSLGALLSWLLTTGITVPVQPRRRLRAIVTKCLQPSPADRYPDATALVADLSRYRAGLPVEAHRESPFERAWRWLEKYRTFILLILAYLIMRTAFAWFSRG
jgi:eukaryotic-like serine/threonine-protein kinase